MELGLGVTTKSNNNKLPTNLPQLQNLIKRDPESYIEEFERQLEIYESTTKIFIQNPTLYNDALQEIVMFFAQISQCYKERLNHFPDDLIKILTVHGFTLHPDMRFSFVRALVLLRNKNMLSPLTLFELFFKLLRTEDKNLRKYLKEQMVTDVKNMNSKSRNVKLNSELQSFFFNMLSDNHAIAIKTSLDILIDLYTRKIWNDPKTVNIIASSCCHKVMKVKVAAVKFFIGKDDTNDGQNSDSESDDNELPTLKQVRMATRVNTKNNKNKNLKKEEKVKLAIQKKLQKKKNKLTFDFSAIHLIHDPQRLAEKLFASLKKLNERFEVRLMMINLISRLVGLHELYLPNFYPYLQRYLFVTQRDVTKIMTYTAQAAHALTSPDDLEPVVRTLADNFVTERYSGEVMAMGLNAIRELCARNPYCMKEDLLEDLTGFRAHKDKGVSLAARSLIVLFREKNPELLVNKDKGAPTELGRETKILKYGESTAQDYIPGAEILSFKTGDEEVQEEGESESEGYESDEEWSDDESDDGTEQNSSMTSNKTKVYSKKEAVKEVLKLSKEERVQKAQEIMSTRVLSDADFKLIDTLQASKTVERFSAGRKKRKQQDLEDAERNDFVSLKSIEMVHKKRRHDKESRIQTIMEGREGRDKFGSRKGRANANASTTNREKIKSKSFNMMKHKLKAVRVRTSFKERKQKLKNALLKQKKFK